MGLMPIALDFRAPLAPSLFSRTLSLLRTMTTRHCIRGLGFFREPVVLYNLSERSHRALWCSGSLRIVEVYAEEAKVFCVPL